LAKYLKLRPMMIAAIGCVLISVCGFYSLWLLFIVAVIFSFVLAVGIAKRRVKMIIVVAIVLLAALNSFGANIKINKTEKFANMWINPTVTFCETTYTHEDFHLGTFEVMEDSVLEKGTKLSLWYSSDIEAGERVKAVIKLLPIEGKYKAALYSENIFLGGYVESVEHTGERDFVIAKVEALRNYIKNTLFRNLGKDEAATMCALVFGNRDYFTDEFYNAVKGAGVAHVMVVSGMHLSIIVSAVMALCERIMKNSLLKGLAILFVVIIMSAVCGFTMSVLRAGITYLIIALSVMVKRPYSGEIALCGTVCIMVIFMPFSVFSIAFQLSVLSTFGILVVAIPVIKYIKSRQLIRMKSLRWLCESVIISLSAMLMVMPVTVVVFGYASTVGIITNILISLPVSYCLILGISGLLLCAVCPILGQIAFLPVGAVTFYINKVILYFGSTEYSVIYLPEWTACIFILIVMIIFYFLLACKKRIDMLKLTEMRRKITDERVKRRNGSYV